MRQSNTWISISDFDFDDISLKSDSTEGLDLQDIVLSLDPNEKDLGFNIHMVYISAQD